RLRSPRAAASSRSSTGIEYFSPAESSHTTDLPSSCSPTTRSARMYPASHDVTCLGGNRSSAWRLDVRGAPGHAQVVVVDHAIGLGALPKCPKRTSAGPRSQDPAPVGVSVSAEPLDDPVDARGERGDVVRLDGREHADAQLVAAQLAVRLDVHDPVAAQRGGDGRGVHVVGEVDGADDLRT